jgi:hypothetical protein
LGAPAGTLVGLATAMDVTARRWAPAPLNHRTTPGYLGG